MSITLDMPIADIDTARDTFSTLWLNFLKNKAHFRYSDYEEFNKKSAYKTLVVSTRYTYTTDYKLQPLSKFSVGDEGYVLCIFQSTNYLQIVRFLVRVRFVEKTKDALFGFVLKEIAYVHCTHNMQALALVEGKHQLVRGAFLQGGFKGFFPEEGLVASDIDTSKGRYLLLTREEDEGFYQAHDAFSGRSDFHTFEDPEMPKFYNIDRDGLIILPDDTDMSVFLDFVNKMKRKK